jgi:hypothetical protein
MVLVSDPGFCVSWLASKSSSGEARQVSGVAEIKNSSMGMAWAVGAVGALVPAGSSAKVVEDVRVCVDSDSRPPGLKGVAPFWQELLRR